MTQSPIYDRDVLIAELQETGIKHSPDKIVRIAKKQDGKIVFLESGDAKSGLEHILSKADQFAKVGIEPDEIPDAVISAVVQGKVVGFQGKKNVRPREIYELTFKGKILYISISVFENGYIVGANPKTQLS